MPKDPLGDALHLALASYHKCDFLLTWKRIMQSFNLDQTITAWSSIAENVFVPHTEEEYERLVEILDCLIDQVGEDETHPLASLMEVIGVIVENYETEHISELEAIA
jgi:HTH-type transcriptional regulator / antitoxin HigA